MWEKGEIEKIIELIWVNCEKLRTNRITKIYYFRASILIYFLIEEHSNIDLKCISYHYQMLCSIIALDIHSVSIFSMESATAMICAAVSPFVKLKSSSIVGPGPDKRSWPKACAEGGKELASESGGPGGLRTLLGKGTGTGMRRG